MSLYQIHQRFPLYKLVRRPPSKVLVNFYSIPIYVVFWLEGSVGKLSLCSELVNAIVSTKSLALGYIYIYISENKLLQITSIIRAKTIQTVVLLFINRQLMEKINLLVNHREELLDLRAGWHYGKSWGQDTV